jgi:hypothetical protein
MPHVDVTTQCLVVAAPGVHVVYPPGRHFVTRSNAESIVAQGAGQIVPGQTGEDGRALAPPAPLAGKKAAGDGE